jgi:ABC-type Mn2+/Zn2+ transport system permease subunit
LPGVLEWSRIWELFAYAILAALLAGLVCPLIGCFLLLRRTGFHGVLLPQLGATGVALGFAILPWWIDHLGLGGLTLEAAQGDPHAMMNWHIPWAALCTFGGLGWLLLAGNRDGRETGRVAAAFAIASAATLLLAQASPFGAEFVAEMLRGEILAVGVHEFETLAAAYLSVLALFVVYQRDFLLISYDRETARVLGRPVLRLEILLFTLIGLTISVGVMIVGPLVLFGLLVLPPLWARRHARTMRSYYGIAVAFGLAAVLLGVWASFALDWPLGAAVVAAGALLGLPGLLWRTRGSRRMAVEP